MSDLTVVICIAFDLRADPEGLENLKKCIRNCEFVDVTMDVTGTFDMIVQSKVPSLAVYSEQMDRIRPKLATFVTRLETNIVAKKTERSSGPDTFMWVPCSGGRKRIDVCMIDKVLAEGDYMRLFVKDWHCLVHSTIRALKDQLGDRFIQLHRSAIVRIDFIDRLVHHDRRWIARLRDGSQQAIAKSHLSSVLSMIAPESSKAKHERAKLSAVTEEWSAANEMQMHATH